MNKGAVLIGVGGALALLALASLSKAAPGGGGGSANGGGGGGDTDKCTGYQATLTILKGNRAAVKAQLVDIDAALMAAYQNEAPAEQVAELESARKVTQQAVASFDSQIALIQDAIAKEC